MEKNWLSVNLNKEVAKAFRSFLKALGIKYEASENYELIHFEVLVDDDELDICDEFLVGL